MKKRFSKIILIAGIILIIPLIAMQFTDEVKWDGLDFLVAGGLLFVAGTAISFILEKVVEAK